LFISVTRTGPEGREVARSPASRQSFGAYVQARM
jgi:hypothetical protein